MELCYGDHIPLRITCVQETFTVTEDMMVHSNTQSPYLGMKLKGVVKQTIVRGHTIYEDGKMTVLKPPGRLLLAGELGDEVGRFGTVAPGGPEVGSIKITKFHCSKL